MISTQKRPYAHEDLECEGLLVEGMGELLPEELLEECDLTQAQAVLHIGSAGGEWLRRLARAYPQLQCLGIEQDERLVRAANALTQQERLSQVAYLVQDMNGITPDLFAQGSFDLVHLSFLSRSILTANYALLAETCATLCRPGGMVCWTEAELPMTNSAAFERLAALICEALEQAGQSFMMEPLLWPTQPGEERMAFQRRHLGITPMVASWLRKAGLGKVDTTSWRWTMGDERVVHVKGYAIECSSGLPLHAGFVRQALCLAQRVKPLLLRTRAVEEEEHAALCEQLERELHGVEFCGLAFLLRAWALRM